MATLPSPMFISVSTLTHLLNNMRIQPFCHALAAPVSPIAQRYSACCRSISRWTERSEAAGRAKCLPLYPSVTPSLVSSLIETLIRYYRYNTRHQIYVSELFSLYSFFVIQFPICCCFDARNN